MQNLYLSYFQTYSVDHFKMGARDNNGFEAEMHYTNNNATSKEVRRKKRKDTSLCDITYSPTYLIFFFFLQKFYRPVCCKKFGKTFKSHRLLLIQINNV